MMPEREHSTLQTLRKWGWGRGQETETAIRAELNIPLLHSKQALRKESFHTFLRILNWRYQKHLANKAAIVPALHFLR